MYATRAITRTLQLRKGAFMSRQSALLRQSQSRGNAAAAAVNVNTNNVKSSNSSALKSSSSTHTDDEAPPDFVRLGIQRMLEQAQQHNNNSYNGNHSHSTTMEENSKALQALELVQDQLEETSLCIADCREAVDAESFQEEYHAADAALDQAVLAFADWLEDVRNRDTITPLREANCAQIKNLRRQLDQLKAEAQPAV